MTRIRSATGTLITPKFNVTQHSIANMDRPRASNWPFDNCPIILIRL